MRTAAILDLGGTTAGAALVAPGPKIISVAERPVAFQESFDRERFLKTALEAGRQALSELLSGASQPPAEIICFLSSPFYAARTNLIRRASPAAFVFKSKLLDQLLGIDLFSPAAEGHEVLESAVIDLRLNGYRTARPEGQKVMEFEAAHYQSVAASRILSRSREMIKAATHRGDARFHSFAYPLFRTVEEVLPADQSYLLLDLGAELSELSLVWRGTLREIISFPQGWHWLIRRLAETLGRSPAESASALKLHLAGHADAEAAKRVAAAVEPLRREWLESCREALKRVLENSFLPGKIYLLGEAPATQLCGGWLAAENWNSLVLGTRQFEVSLLGPAFFTPLLGETPKVKNLPLLVEIIFYDRILSKQNK